MIRRLNIDQIILTLLLLILVVQDSRSFQSKIALNDKAFEIGTFSSMLISRSIKDILLQLNDEMEFKGKLLYIRKEDNLKEMLNKYFKINSYWFILLDSVDSYHEIEKYINFPEENRIYTQGDTKALIPYNIRGVIFNKDKMNSSDKISTTAIPCFYLDNDSFPTLMKYDIDTEEFNVISTISISLDNLSEQKIIAQYILLFMSITLLSAFFLMSYYYKIRNEQRFLLIKIIKYLLGLFIILLSLLTLTIFLYGGKDDEVGILGSYLITILFAVLSAFKAIFWFIVFVISFGWNVYISNYNYKDKKFILAVFMVTYLAIVSDMLFFQMSYIQVFEGISIKDIKNIIFFLLFSSYLIFCSLRGMKLLKYKLLEAIEFSSTYVPFIIKKIKFLK